MINHRGPTEFVSLTDMFLMRRYCWLSVPAGRFSYTGKGPLLGSYALLKTESVRWPNILQTVAQRYSPKSLLLAGWLVEVKLCIKSSPVGRLLIEMDTVSVAQRPFLDRVKHTLPITRPRKSFAITHGRKS